MFKIYRIFLLSLVLHLGQILGCTFCDIRDGKLPAKIIAQNTEVMVIESIRPMQPSHWLIIPKTHIPDLQSATDAQEIILGRILMAASKLSKQLERPGHFNLIINNGANAGQTIFHLHAHFYSQNTLAVINPQI